MVDGNRQWKERCMSEGLRVNVSKTKDMQLLFGKKSSVLKVNPCGVCGERVDCNFIQCTGWVHRRCSDMPRQVSLLPCRDVFVCRTCLSHNCCNCNCKHKMF